MLTFRFENNQKKLVFIFFASLLIILITYGVFLRNHYGLDSYATFAAKTRVSQVLSMGRFTGALLAKADEELHFDTVNNQIWSTTFLIFSLSLGISFLTYASTMQEKYNNLGMVIVILLSYAISVVSIFMSEWFLFPENAYMIGIGYLLTILSAILLVYSDARNKFIYLSIISLILAQGVYQVFIEFFIIYAICLYNFREPFFSIQNRLKSLLKVLGVGMVGAVISIVLPYFYNKWLNISLNARMSGITFSTLFNNITNVWNLQDDLLLRNLYLSKSVFYLFTIVVLISLLLIVQIKRGKSLKYTFFFDFSVIFICYCCLFLPHYLSSIFWPVPRTILVYFALFCLCVSILIPKELGFSLIKPIIFLAVINLLINFLDIQQIANDCYVNNSLDKQFAYQVAYEISKYEESNNTKITSLAITNDLDPYSGQYLYIQRPAFDVNISQRVVQNYGVDMINFYTGLQLTRVEMDKAIYDKFFLGKDYKFYDASAQFAFYNDTLYILSY